MSTVAEVIAIAPEFTNDARVQDFIDRAVIVHDSTYWGVAYSQGIAYYVAHQLTTHPVDSSDPAGISGTTVNSVTTARASVAYGNAAVNEPSDAEFQSTVYGRNYMILRDTRQSISPMFVTL